MRFHIITLFPEMFAEVFSTSILKRIQDKKLIEVSFYHLREFGKGKYHQVDDVPYGGGAGMVMMPEPLAAAIKKAKNPKALALLIVKQHQQSKKKKAK